MGPRPTTKLNCNPRRSEAALYPNDGIKLIIFRSAPRSPCVTSIVNVLTVHIGPVQFLLLDPRTPGGRPPGF